MCGKWWCYPGAWEASGPHGQLCLNTGLHAKNQWNWPQCLSFMGPGDPGSPLALAPVQLEAQNRVSPLKAMGMGSNQALHHLWACSAFSPEDTLIWTITSHAWSIRPPQEPLTANWIECVFPISWILSFTSFRLRRKWWLQDKFDYPQLPQVAGSSSRTSSLMLLICSCLPFLSWTCLHPVVYLDDLMIIPCVCTFL